MPAQNQRRYPCKDVEVLTVSGELISNAQANLPAIIAKRANWTDPFFPNLKIRVNNAFQTYLGVDNAADLRSKTNLVLTTMIPAKADLSTFKIGIEADFKSNKSRLTEIQTLLGFTQYWKAVTRNDQEALVELLYRFKQNMTPALTTEITTAGTATTLITTIKSYADTLKDANVNQEFAKSTRPVTTAAGVTEFNEIYDEIIKVCKICRNLFKDDPIQKDNFSFAAVKRRLNTPPPPKQKAAAPKP